LRHSSIFSSFHFSSVDSLLNHLICLWTHNSLIFSLLLSSFILVTVLLLISVLRSRDFTSVSMRFRSEISRTFSLNSSGKAGA
jgi:hypothetical protein